MDDNTKHELTNLRLRTQAEVQRMWELLMQPLGFGSTSLWVNLVDDHDAPVPMLMQITDTDAVPSEEEIANLFMTLTHVMAETEGLGSVAFLITHPGSAGVTDFDRELSTRLLAGARDARVSVQPIHVANDSAVIAVAPDDLAA